MIKVILTYRSDPRKICHLPALAQLPIISATYGQP